MSEASLKAIARALDEDESLNILWILSQTAGDQAAGDEKSEK